MYFFFLILMFIMMVYLKNLVKFNPMVNLMILVIFSILISIKMNYLNYSMWYSYIFFLIMVGGILILFMYLTSVSSNEIIMNYMKFYKNFMLKLILNMFLMFFVLIYYLKFIYITNFKIDLLNLIKMNYFEFNNYKSLYLNMFIDLNLYLMIYLFLLMVVVVLICLIKSLPLRQMN